jgi:nitrite reductase (NADH) large subunit
VAAWSGTDAIGKQIAFDGKRPHVRGTPPGFSQSEFQWVSQVIARRERKTIVIIGNGMVGHRFCERLIEYDVAGEYRLVTFCEEPRAAYDRVGLTSFFAHRDAEKLMIARKEWYLEHGIELHIGDRACEIDRTKKLVRSDKGVEIAYDSIVMATGSFPFVPPVPGIKNLGVFVYRTIEDLQHMIEYAKHSKRCAVIGGGLLGLEAAKAAFDLGLETHVIEFAPRLMPRQIDDRGSKVLVSKIESLGVKVHLNIGTKEVLGNGRVEGLKFNDDTELQVDMLVVSAGIRPRDDLAKASGLELGARGGIAVNDHLRTSDPNIFAIGECALHSGMIYGLVAPGYDMAEIVAANFCGADRTFGGADMSTKLKLMGVDVASFGNYEADEKTAKSLVFEDPFDGIYKKILVSHDGKKLLGGMLVGNADDYGRLLMTCKSDKPLGVSPSELLLGPKGHAAGSGVEDLDDSAQICSCNNVSKGKLCAAIASGICTVADLKSCTKAGAGCGGCVPLVTDLLNSELKKAGKTVNTSLCEHFAFTRQDLFDIVKVKGHRTFEVLIAGHGKGHGCEICKPAVASILASLWNEDIVKHATLQDTNDRFLANIQRGGSYSVVPRVPGGEITPDKLIVLGEVGRKYNLYTKITGGQRIDLFGAEVHQLPSIWEELVNAGFESGHAYGKALRTVKSCVGSTWCRYGVQDSVGFAIRVENRYKGLRSPHKLKSAVSGCVRECAEAQSKDFGLIATETGYNLYVCGNGGSKPRHADLLAADLDEATAIKYIDRFLMYYVQTADRLTRTSVWLDKMEGGIDHLRDVIVHDKLGICEDLERQMQFVVDTYKCEWAEVVRDPEKRRLFQQFVNTDETEPTIEFVSERGQAHPAPWGELVQLGGTGGRVDGALGVRNAEFGVRSEEGGAGNAELNGFALSELKGAHSVDGDHSTDVAEFDDSDSNMSSNGSSNGSDSASSALRTPHSALAWLRVGSLTDFPVNGGATIKHGHAQIAVFNFDSRGEWYATDNMCPHRQEFVLSRGIIGDTNGIPKVACPIHKKNFSLQDGSCLSGEEYSIRTYPVKVEDGDVFLLLPPAERLALVPAIEQRSCGSSCLACAPV